MKAILISVQPQWVEKILNGIKKDEIRKGTALYKAINKLIKKQGVAPVYLYCTKGKPYYFVSENCIYKTRYDYTDNLNGKVVARFNATAEEIIIEPFGEELTAKEQEVCEKSCLSFEELNKYLKGQNGTVIHINDLEIFDKPKELSDFFFDRLPPKEVPQSWRQRVTKAPQSWCYVRVSQ